MKSEASVYLQYMVEKIRNFWLPDAEVKFDVTLHVVAIGLSRE